MKKKFVLSVIASACCAFTAAADFSGQWDGTWYSVLGTSGSMSADVSQVGNALSGWSTFDTAYYGSYVMPVTGMVSGETADMDGEIIVDGSIYRIEYTQASLSPSGTTLYGNYTITEDGSLWDMGTFEMQKPSPGLINDLFVNAVVLTGASGQVSGINVDATKETGEPDHAGEEGGTSVWWKWTAPYNCDVVIDTFGSDFDTLLAVYTGNTIGALVEITSNDQAAEGNQSEVLFSAVANTTYRIAVDGYYGDEGSIVLNWAATETIGTWSPMSTNGMPNIQMMFNEPDVEQRAEIWTGSRWLVYGDSMLDGTPTGALYDPSADAWTAMSVQGAPDIDFSMSYKTVWTGSRWLVYGDSMTDGTPAGALYNPSVNAWTAMSMEGAPDIDLMSCKAVWTGSRWLVCGYSMSAMGFAGALYDPSANAWTAMSMEGAPDIDLMSYEAVWTGSRWLVCGYSMASMGFAGALYDPSADAWTAMNMTGAPDISQMDMMSVWTGSRWLVCGYSMASMGFAGALYDPSANAWTAMSMNGVPDISQMDMMSVWTGSRWLVCGYSMSSMGLAGALYNPSANAWTAMSMAGAPNIEMWSAKEVWTGAKWLVFGYDYSRETSTGTLYDPVANSWSAMSVANVSDVDLNSCRTLWTGKEWLVWGSSFSNPTDNVGGRYALPDQIAQYTLNVVGGSGSGLYTSGANVTIAAHVSAEQTFDRWIGDVQYLANVASASTTVTMPAATITVTATFKKTGLAHLGAFFDTGDPAEMQGAAARFQEAVTISPQDYTSRVYAAFAKVSNMINDSELNALMEQFGFTYEDLGGENGWDITGEFNVAGAPPSNQAIDTVWTRCQPGIDEAYTLLNAIPSSWTGMAEISTNVFPVDETVYVDYPDVVSAKALLMAVRSFMNTVRAYDMTVDYAKLDWPVTLLDKAITVDGNPADWTDVPALLVGQDYDALQKVKACRSGNTVYVQIEKETLQQRYDESFEGVVKVKINGARQNLDIWYGTKYNNGSGVIGAWFRTGNMVEPVLGTSVLTMNCLEMAFPIPPEIGTLTVAGNIEWVWYGWWVDFHRDNCELESPKNNSANDLLALVPDVMKSVRNAAALPLAKADLSSAITLAQDAGTRIKNRTGSELHFFEYDPEYQVEYDDTMTKLAQAQTSLTVPTLITLDENVVNLYLGAFYTAPFVTRDMRPAYGVGALLNDPIQGTFPDPTFGGVAPNLTRSNLAEWITGDKNLVLQANGGVLESYTSQYDAAGWKALNLTDGAVGSGTHNWISANNPGTQTFEYSFSGGQSANLTSLTLVNATRAYNAKDFQLWVSADGIAWEKVKEGTLADNGQPQTFELGSQIAKRARLLITSGYRSDYWELAEIELYGYCVEPPPSYTVTFDAQGGSTAIPMSKTVISNMTYGVLATTTRAGYTFAGWWTAPNGGGTEMTPSTTVTITSAQTLYAKWIVNAVSTVTFDAQGGTAPVPSSTTVTNGLVYGTLAATTRTGYTFAGWWTGVGGTGAQVTSGTAVTITSAQTLYAKWTEIPVLAVTFDAQGGTAPIPSATTVTNGLTYGTLAATTRAGYTFAGWWTAPNGGGAQVTSGTTVTITSAQMLYAKWTVNAVSAVTFDAQGGTTPIPTSTIVTNGLAYGTLAATARAGYTFAGWWTAPNGGGTQVTSGTTVTVSSAQTLYAKWTVNAVSTVTFDAQSGTTPIPTSTTVTNGLIYGTLAATTRTGYTFAGWWTAPNGGGSQVTSSTTVTITSAQTLYAKWSVDVRNLVLQSNGGVLQSYTSQYDAAGWKALNLTDGAVGSGTHNWISANNPGTQTFEYSFSGGQSANLTSLTLVNATRAYNAKDFQLWVSADGIAWDKVKEGTLADNGQSQTFELGSQIAKRVRLVITSGYAATNWELAEFELYGYFVEPVPSYTVTFDGQGGTTPSPASKNVLSNMTYGVLATTTRAGYTLAGWWTAPNGGGTEVTPSTTVTITSAQTLYAKWIVNAVSTVTFDAQGGTAPVPSSTTVTNGLVYGALAATTRTGYTFAGWWTGAGGTGAQVTSGTAVTITSAQTLYAKWTEIPVLAVTFDAQGGTAPIPSATTVTNGLTYGALAATTRTGYTFAGWWTAPNGGGAQVTSGTTVTITSAQTLYAKWTVNAVSAVTFDAQGGTTPIPTSTIVTNGLAYGTLAATARAGYTFAGWWTAPNGGGTQVTSGTTVTVSSAQTLYAKWTVNAVSTVTFDAQSGTTPIPSSTTVTNGLIYGTLAATTRTGYTFAGWWTAPNGGGSQVTSSTTVTITSAQTLYAKWSVDVRNLVLQSNGGVLESYTSQYDAAGWKALNLTDGAVGSGTHNWISAANPGQQAFEYSFAGGQTALLTGLTLVNATRAYNAKDFQLWVSADGIAWDKVKEGTLADNGQPQAFGLDGHAAKRVKLVLASGYRTDYWELAEFELYGYFGEPPPSYTVTFDAQGGSAAVPMSKTVISNMTYGVLATTTRAGYTLAGWWTAPNGGGTEVFTGTPVTITAAQTLYAKWTEIPVLSVTFAAQGGTAPSPSATTVTNGLPYGALAATTRTGYTFAGWWTAPDGGGTEVTPGTTVTATSAQTLYAKWIVDVKNLVLQANGGVLESYTSQYDAAGWKALNLTDGAVGSFVNNWISAAGPGPQTFEYSFSGGQSAKLTSLTLVNATRAYNAKGFEISISTNGSTWAKIKEGALENNGTPQSFSLDGQVAKRVRLVLTSGYRADYWELAEFKLEGYYYTEAPNRPIDDWYAEKGIAPGPGETREDMDNRIPPGKRTTLLQEYIADTDPNDINSVLRVQRVDPGPPALIQFEPASTRRVYTLQFTDDLTSATWHDVPNAVRHSGAGGEDLLPDDDAPLSGHRFYRVKVELP